MPRCVILLVVLLCWGANAAAPGLVRVGDAWRWQAVPAGEPGLPGPWLAPDFDDTAWPSATSGFAADPYGGEVSQLLSTPPSGPIRFRTRFELLDPAEVAWLGLRLDWSGGVVVYLNGAEIARRNLPGNPGDPVPAAALPVTTRYRGNADLLDCTPSVTTLRAGSNVLAIQWHPPPGAYGSALVPELLANFTRGPFLQRTTATSQGIAWRTLTPTDAAVEFGETPALGRVAVDPTPGTNHLVTLANLAPDTQYYYRIRSSDGARTAASPVQRFRTFKDAGPLRFVVAADVGGGTRPQLQLAGVMRAVAPDFVLVNGDLVYPHFAEGLADQRFFSMYHQQMATTPFFAAAGNHDTVYSSPWPFFDAFYLPTNSVPLAEHQLAGTSPEHYYSFEVGDAHFTVLYTPLYYSGLELTPNSPQVRWLESDLAGSTKPWKVIFLHLPLVSSGPHGDDDYNYNGVPDPAELANLLLPLAARYGVQLVCSAHDHAYERFHPQQGVQCLVSGGGGGSLYALERRRPESAQFHYRWNCVQVDIAGDELHAQARDENGAVFDEFFLRRTPPPPREYAADWHTPAFDTAAAPDGDGNLSGQRFDFAGEAIPTAPGDISNLGRVWVNHDHFDLHVGFERVMIPTNANVFLFIESPHRPGVSAMAGLGNGIVDPEGEGADGLDFLENLAFQNFQPTLAGVLGDEFADGQFRSYPRTNIVAVGLPPPLVITNLASNLGQGVFQLGAGFPDVPGARVQQFNRSPQADPVQGEQNADFIVVSVPLAALGAAAGDVLKLGAVVGVGEFTGAPAPRGRKLDRSFLGAQLTLNETGEAVLEGLAVRLGPDLDPDGDGLTSAQEAEIGTRPDNPDSDGDGLPDGWELAHGLNPLSPGGRDGAGGDPDGDHFDNAAEFAAGTRPDLAASALRLGARRRPDGQIEFRWPAVVGRRYQLEWAAGLDAGFQAFDPAAPPQVARGATESLLLPAEWSAGGPRFFRLRLAP